MITTKKITFSKIWWLCPFIFDRRSKTKDG